MSHASPDTVHCAVYRCAKQDDMYVYLPADAEPDALPAALRQRTGALSHVMDLELTPARPLARVDATDVIRRLADPGYFIQMPENPLTVNLYRGD